MRKFSVALGLVAAVIFAAPASADMVMVKAYTNLSFADMQNILQGMGYRAEMGSDDVGPYIKSAADGYIFYVNLYDCDKAPEPRCESAELVTATFTMHPTAQQLLTWNRGSWWAHGIFDKKGDPYLRMDFSTKGGITEDAIKNYLDLYEWRLGEFVKFLQNPASAAPAESNSPSAK